MAATETSKATKPPVAKKSVEARDLAGRACLQQADTPCAQVELAGMPPNSPYANLLEAQIAASQQDFDAALRLLTPLQANGSLMPQANASLHATLAQAYENQGNVLRAIEQLNQSALLDPAAQPNPGTAEDPEEIHQHIWRLLKALPRETLLELRGGVQDTLTQGWVDLALAATAKVPASAIAQWRIAYPDHPISEAFLQQLSQAEPAAAPTEKFEGTVALLLPLNEPAYATVATAVQAGLMAARDGSTATVKVYATRGDKTEIVAIYQQAVAEGAQYIVGPMSREEVNALATSGIKLIPTLALNAADPEHLPDNLAVFGLPVEAEATQVAKVARAHGMQTAIVVGADTPLAKRMEQAFIKEWTAQEASVVAQKTFTADSNLAELKADLAGQQADMIFLAANTDQARLVRPYLNPAIPTFATSHVYDGAAQRPENAVLSAIHFVDMPWIVNADHPDFAAYREAAAKLPSGEAQRWFAVGVDAWHIVAAQAAGKPLLLHGLSGNLHREGNTLVRELPMAQFRNDGVDIE